MKTISDRVSQLVFITSFFISLLALPCTSFGQAVATEVDTWSCLPEETAFAVRIPNGKAFAKQFVENTKLGSVVFSEKRKALVTKAIAEHGSADWGEFHAKLDEFGLKPDELLQMLAGESGFAVVITEDDQEQSVPLGLAWLQPGEELATRIMEIHAELLDTQDDKEHPVTRVDVELAGLEVMQLTFPSVSTVYDEEFEYPDNYKDLPEEERETAWEAAYEKWENSAREKVTYFVTLVVAQGDRVLLAHTFDSSESEDFHPHGQLLAGMFARVLEAHEQGEGDFAKKYSGNEQVARVMGIEGIPCLELVGDARPLMKLFEQVAPDAKKLDQVKQFTGYESWGPFALKSALDGGMWESQLTVEIAEPREGLMRLVEQESIDIDPPAWIPASAVSYSQLSFDFRGFYTLIKNLVAEQFPELSRYFGLADMQVFGFAQANVEDVLGSLGTQHKMATFPGKAENAEQAAKQNPEAVVIVWQLADEQIWKNIFKASAPMVKSMPGGEVSDEQGYTGFRFSNNDSDASVFLGNGKLVLVVGPDVVETVLSALNDPPEGTNSYREDTIYQNALELLPSTTGIGFTITDGNKNAVLLRDWLLASLENIESMREAMLAAEETDQDEDYWMIGVVKKLLPDDNEIENILGLSVSSYDVDAHGLQFFSIQELPPPEE